MEENQRSVKMLALDSDVVTFKSSWGTECKPVYNEALNKWLLPLGWEQEINAREVDFDIIDLNIFFGAYYRRTEEIDESGNYYLEYSSEVTLSDGTVINYLNKDIYDGVEGWHWYEDGEFVSIATPSTWEKIKNFFNIG